MCFGRPGATSRSGGTSGRQFSISPPPDRARTHVVECSSYQIDLAPSLAPSVGLLINITPDHLDRHGDLAGYAAVKERLVARSDVALIGVDDEICRAIYARLKARGEAPRVVAVSGGEQPVADFYVSSRRVMARGCSEPLADLDRARALCGAPTTDRTPPSPPPPPARSASRVHDIARGFATFPGLAHRMEEVGRLGRVLFVNDSKATNADAAEKALLSFQRHPLDLRRQGRKRAASSRFARCSGASPKPI